MNSNYQNGDVPTDNTIDLFDLKSMIDIKTNQKFINVLREMGYICKDRIYPTQEHIDSGDFVIYDYVKGSEIVSQFFVTITIQDEILDAFGVKVDRFMDLYHDRYGDPIFSNKN